MIKYLQEDAWKIIENGFHPEFQLHSESIFSIGNGQFGQRANFEEKYSGDSFQGSYVAGVYFPDKTKVGWWKNGYPEHFAKVINSVNWIGIDVILNGNEVDLHTANVLSFQRELDLKKGLLKRVCQIELPTGERIRIDSERFCSMADNDLATIEYKVTLLEGAGKLEIVSYLDADVRNKDANSEGSFWDLKASRTQGHAICVHAKTKKTGFEVAVAARTQVLTDGKEGSAKAVAWQKKGYAKSTFKLNLAVGESAVVRKFIGILSSRNHSTSELVNKAIDKARHAEEVGIHVLRQTHFDKWARIWEQADIEIEGDVAAQQGIRFNIFQLNQTYTGQDDRLNLGPLGFTGEKFGGSTYWDTEAYCLPFFLNTHDPEVAEQLLIYRYNQLDKAIANAEKLGFADGAALYPMVTMNGEECHNEWEITFEEIHRNGAIAFAIYNYVRHTGNTDYLSQYGFDVLLAICRFWAQRVSWSEAKQAYVILGVTGPNEYENNVNNNWYTNYIAKWCFNYTLKVILFLKQSHQFSFAVKADKWGFDEENETQKWADIVERLYLPLQEGSDVFLQQDGFLDKELNSTEHLSPEDRPLHQKWSWDRILRSAYVKQADVLQGMFLFEDHFTQEQHEANFDFYEPLTVHEASLSPCIHAILAAKLGRADKAYEMYLRTSRLNLDNYNNETHQGLHITSMAGTWMSVVKGFGGLRVKKDTLYLSPMLPSNWNRYSFKIVFRGRELHVDVSRDFTDVTRTSGDPLTIVLNDREEKI